MKTSLSIDHEDAKLLLEALQCHRGATFDSTDEDDHEYGQQLDRLETKLKTAMEKTQ